MRKQIQAAPKPKTLAERFVDHLEGEVALLRSQNEFLAGKIERLELAIMEFRSEPSQVYVARTDQATRPKITEVPVNRPLEKKDFPSIRRQWDAMTAEEQEKAVQEGFEVLQS